MSFKPVTVQRSYEQIVEHLQHAIRGGVLARGSKLPTERELAIQFGVSRSVVREAIKVLAAQGLVESRQGSGVYVLNRTIETVSRAFVLSVSPDAESVERLFEFRQGLEMEAARLAALRRTDDHLAELVAATSAVNASTDPQAWDLFGASDATLHRTIALASANPYLQVAIATARDMQRDVVSLFAEHTGAMHVAIAHHNAIVQAIATGDSAEAATRMGEHITYTSSVVQSHVPAVSPDHSERSS